jgi:hypothetical protein
LAGLPKVVEGFGINKVMAEIVCPECRSTAVHRSKRAGFREEIMLRFLFAQPFRCWNCKARFYRAGNRWGLNFWVMEHGWSSSKSRMLGDEEEIRGAKITKKSLDVEQKPPTFWTEPGRNMQRPLPTRSPRRSDPLEGTIPLAGPERTSEGLSHARQGRERPPASLHRPHMHRSPRRFASRQTRMMLWLMVIVALATVFILYLFSLFSSKAKQQRLVHNPLGIQAAQPRRATVCGIGTGRFEIFEGVLRNGQAKRVS